MDIIHSRSKSKPSKTYNSLLFFHFKLSVIKYIGPLLLLHRWLFISIMSLYVIASMYILSSQYASVTFMRAIISFYYNNAMHIYARTHSIFQLGIVFYSRARNETEKSYPRESHLGTYSCDIGLNIRNDIGLRMNETRRLSEHTSRDWGDKKKTKSHKHTRRKSAWGQDSPAKTYRRFHGSIWWRWDTFECIKTEMI